MKKIPLFLLIGLLLAACVKNDKDEQPILVTDIVMPAEGTVFKPGDKVTIKAQGFEENDRIMLHGRWRMAGAPDGEAYYISPAKVTELTVTNLTFLAPGYNPPATVEVKLLRSGDRVMTLGKISVDDGRVPEDPQLYGIINNKSGLIGVPYAVECIDLKTDIITTVAYLNQKNLDFSRVVGTSGEWAWGLFGIHTDEGYSSITRLDLSMHYWQDMTSGPIITLGALGSGAANIAYIYKVDENTLHVNGVNSTVYTRDQDLAPPNRQQFSLPEGMKPEALSHYPCVLGDGGYLLLSADNGNGSFSPVVLDLAKVGGKANVGAPIEAAKLIPFWTALSVESADPNTYERATGCAVVLPNNQGTELRLLDKSTMTLKKPFATLPQSARSIATLAKNTDTRKLYILCDTESGGRLIKVYDMKTTEWNQIKEINTYEEIALTW